MLGKLKYILFQMQVKQQYEVVVFPKIFTIMNFYSKGLYSLEISLTAQQLSTGALVKGFPHLIQGNDAVKNDEKKAKIIIKNDKLAYSSQNFYVTFSSQNFYFHTLPHFKLQLQRQKRYKVWIEFSLILTQYKISKNTQKDVTKSSTSFLALGTIDQKIVVVDTKKLFLNNIKQLNTYQRILFSEPDYFSYTDAYIFAMKTQTSLRPHQFSLYDFHLSPIEERSRLHLVKSQQLKGLVNGLMSGSTVEIKSYFNEEGIVDFYRYMIQEAISEYKNLAHVFQHFRAMMLTLNNSTLIENVAIPYLDYIGKSIFSQNSQQKRTQIQLKSLIQDYYQTDNQAEIYVEILHEAELISKNKKWLVKQLCHLMVKMNYNVFELLAVPVVKDKMDKKERLFVCHGDIQKEKQARHLQFINFRQNYCLQEQVVEDVDIRHPFIMLEGYEDEKPQDARKQGIPPYLIDNLVVFVHGYQGSDFDLQIAKYNLEMYNSHCYCLMSTSIQDEMDEPIEYLGQQLATEIREHIKHTYNSYKRINFVGYSLGGIVIRDAMKHLQEFKQKMNIFMSLASPHAGTIDGGNLLIKTGIWYLINFQNAKNLKQLHCQFQGKQQQNFVLKKLSQCSSLQWFKKFIVASSQQDSFVPYPSSRIDSIEGSSITKIMCENIKKRIRKLERVEVWFDVAENVGTFDRILGRKAHIEFLENKVFLHCLFKLYATQF